jgi:hypothetical protein
VFGNLGQRCPAELIEELGGPEQVAEMTGRSARVLRQGGRLVYCTRGKADAEVESLNMHVRPLQWLLNVSLL